MTSRRRVLEHWTEVKRVVADRYAAIVARWWNGTVEKGG
jgi:hypothetical protein